MALGRVHVQSAKDQVVELLRAALARGDYPPSSRLIEDEIAERLGTSRIPVREALATLVAQGLLVRRTRGVFVPDLNPAEIEQIYLAREALESPLYERAAAAMRDVDIARLRHLHRELMAADTDGAIDAFGIHNHAFHFAILERAELPLVLELVDQLWARTSFYRAFFWLKAEHRRQTIDEHEQIIETCGRRDGPALVAVHRRHRGRMLRYNAAWRPAPADAATRH
jgi:DNA-binding GntR family transcriptional regulator